MSAPSVVETDVGGGGGNVEADAEAPIIGDDGSEELLPLRITSHESRGRSSLFARSACNEQGRVSDKSIFSKRGITREGSCVEPRKRLLPLRSTMSLWRSLRALKMAKYSDLRGWSGGGHEVKVCSFTPARMSVARAILRVFETRHVNDGRRDVRKYGQKEYLPPLK